MQLWHLIRRVKGEKSRWFPKNFERTCSAMSIRVRPTLTYVIIAGIGATLFSRYNHVLGECLLPYFKFEIRATLLTLFSLFADSGLLFDSQLCFTEGACAGKRCESWNT